MITRSEVRLAVERLQDIRRNVLRDTSYDARDEAHEQVIALLDLAADILDEWAYTLKGDEK